jgi:dTMP kinase
MEKKEIAFHRRVQQGYQELAAAHPQLIRRVDASGTEIDIQTQVRAILGQYLFVPH